MSEIKEIIEKVEKPEEIEATANVVDKTEVLINIADEETQPIIKNAEDKTEEVEDKTEEVEDKTEEVEDKTEEVEDKTEEVINDVDEETEAMIKKADDMIDNAINDVMEETMNKMEMKTNDIENEDAKIATQIAITIVNEAIDKNEETIDNVTDKVFEALVEKTKEMGVKKSTLALIIKFVMEAVEDTPMKGSEQKEYSLRLIKSLVIELAEGEDKEYLLIAIDSGSVGDTIDLIVAASKGELNVNMVIDTAASSCLPCFMGILAKRGKKSA
uniref:Uncharacterized protein n=1 Tax=viral metagenome TaxID=1070528 RepID=A0A6C0LKE0_9ZZZZ